MAKAPRQPIRKLRHWKQIWNKNAAFIWRRPTTYGGKEYQPGDAIPKELQDSPTKLRRFWESKRIELAEFEAPNVATGQRKKKSWPDGTVSVTHLGGAWFAVKTPDDEFKFRGRANVDEYLASIGLAFNDIEVGEAVG